MPTGIPPRREAPSRAKLVRAKRASLSHLSNNATDPASKGRGTMHMHRVRVIRASLHCALFVTSFIAATAHAQIAGENVNMVSGTEWPGGDKFLQRQNEPSIAVSSANSQHLLAGANDYRSVDLAFPDVGAKKTTGDSWLGLFKSLDGGQTWRSVLLPGYPQACDDPAANPDGLDPSAFPYARPHPLCGHPAAADPVVRA